MSDLRESGSIEQDADMVVLLHREELYERESPRAGEADFIVAKHRNGPTATITVAFQGHYSRFVDMARASGRRTQHITRGNRGRRTQRPAAPSIVRSSPWRDA